MTKFSNRAVPLGTLKPGDRFTHLPDTHTNRPTKQVVSQFGGLTYYYVGQCTALMSTKHTQHVFPEIANNENTTTMSQQENSIYYMVHNRTNGGMPSVTHADYATAVEEARRLAKANTGQKFVILKAAVSVMVKTPEPTVTALG